MEALLQQAGGFVKNAALPAAQEALTRGNGFLQTAALPAAQTALSHANDFVNNAALPAWKNSIQHATADATAWKDGSAISIILGGALQSFPVVVVFAAHNPWVLLLPVFSPVLLAALQAWLSLLGFQPGGIAAGSIAAAVQAAIGNVPVASLFAFLQSFGARGFAHRAVAAHTGQSLVLAVLLAAAGKTLLEKGLALESIEPVLLRQWDRMALSGERAEL
ncbi:hypothetical protein FN846DRAFT_970081 [Sphaerosporella brunnea]|uniref:Uncharacterized protein n=1 Tax=Sphaerosporella brunnea TaxID=1250544 RepID=A0A5J5EI07_9PEZI|nr:hypothetical protein FN846DRAFT_970081 [Sphaerosporella brunnea]